MWSQSVHNVPTPGRCGKENSRVELKGEGGGCEGGAGRLAVVALCEVGAGHGGGRDGVKSSLA